MINISNKLCLTAGRGLTVHQQRYRPCDSSKNDIQITITINKDGDKS